MIDAVSISLILLMSDAPKPEGNPQSDPNSSIQLKVSDDQQAGVFSNAVSVSMTRDGVVIDFGYILPNVKPTTIKVVSRVNMTHMTTESFLKVLQNAVLDWRNKQKE